MVATNQLRQDADFIIRASLSAVSPDAAVKRALTSLPESSGRVVLVAAGKAAWQMAKAAYDVLGGRIDDGVVITKYEHVRGAIGNLTCYEAGHPVPDENSFRAAEAALNLVRCLNETDIVLFLLSGGGSALFEKPLVPGEELQDITKQLLACGANIVEMNILRKRLSAVKGGRFAKECHPARVFSVVLSDIIGDPLDMIASGPAYPDSSTCTEAKAVVQKYNLNLSEEAKGLLEKETPKTLSNVETHITGSVRELCEAAKAACESLGYESLILSDCLECQAREAGRFLSSIVRTHCRSERKLAFVAGGETVVKLTGKGLGGRNQEIALAAAEGIDGLNAAVFSVGSDGTDGPTDAAGGYVDGTSFKKLAENGISLYEVLEANDSYHALEKIDGLIKTGPTGTNVNDVSVALLRID